MNLLKKVSLFILLIIGISSCNIQNGFIQKRKYQKGYHVSLKKKNAAQHDVKQSNETLTQEYDSKIEEVIRSTENNAQTESKNEILEDSKSVNKNDIAESNDTPSSVKSNPFTVNKGKIKQQLRKLNGIKPIINSNNTAERSNSNDNSDLVNILLIILLVILAITLFHLIDGLLGGLLGLILLIIVIIILLKYLGVI